MLATSRAKLLASTAAVFALAGSGVAMATAPANAGIIPLPDVSVSTVGGGVYCYANVTNIGTVTARDVTAHPVGQDRGLVHMGSIAPGEIKQTPQYLGCLFSSFHIYVTTSNGDSNPFNNVGNMNVTSPK